MIVTQNTHFAFAYIAMRDCAMQTRAKENYTQLPNNLSFHYGKLFPTSSTDQQSHLMHTVKSVRLCDISQIGVLGRISLEMGAVPLPSNRVG